MNAATGRTPVPPTPCPRLHDSGAYVLGALDETERQDYERHLATCAECSAAVAEFADLPALMRASDGSGETRGAQPGSEPPEVPVPDTLLPRLLHAISAEERRAHRRRVGLGLVAAAAAAVIGGASMAVVDANLHDSTSASASATPSGTDQSGRPGQLGSSGPASPSGANADRVALASEPGAPIEAYVLVQPKAWGTSFETHCTYTGTGPGGYPVSGDYELVAVDAAGQEHTVSTWTAGSGATVHVVPASSYLAMDQIRALRLTTASGTLVASADL